MAHLNYNHLHYFWVVSTFGSIAKAAESLHVTPQTISGQLRTLEARLGSALFRKTGRNLVLTETGQVVRSYAEPMFTLGRELRDVLSRRTPRCSSPLTIGIATGVPKLITHCLIAPALELSSGTRVMCYESSLEGLVADLLACKIDVALADSPVSSTRLARVQNYLVAQSGVTVFCARDFAEGYRARFPRSLDGAPFMLPARPSALRDSLSDWFRREGIAPSTVAEIASPDLMCALCETNAALFALPSTIAGSVERMYDVSAVGEVATIEQQFYAISIARDIGHESVLAIIEDARERLQEQASAKTDRPASREAAMTP